MAAVKEVVRVAAMGDLHHSRTAPAGSLQPLFAQISEAADVLVICGDLTDYGLAEEARSLARELAVAEDPGRGGSRQPRLPVGPGGGDRPDHRRRRRHATRRRDDRSPRHRLRRHQGLRRRLRTARARAVGRGHHQAVRPRGGQRSAEARDRAGAAANQPADRGAALLADPGNRRRRAAGNLSRSSGAAASRNRSRATPSPRCSTATRITDVPRAARGRTHRSTTSRYR